MNISKLADSITTSPILTFAAEVNSKIAAGEKIYNLTVGDFNSSIYQIPDELKQGIIKAYQDNHTNYPGAFGLLNLRKAIKSLNEDFFQVAIDVDNILISSGSRPLIYSAYKTIVDPDDKVLFPVPSWNNDYYTILSAGNPIIIETKAENNFMPTKQELEPHLHNASLLALCSPQNPTGTMLSRQQVADICQLIVAENQRRGKHEKPLYVMFDQVYCLLAFEQSSFHHAQKINQDISKYAIFIEGMSKAFAGTGIRVGWATGPKHIIAKMRSLVAHLGAWAPKAEQHATGEYLNNLPAVNSYLADFNQRLSKILNKLHTGFQAMKTEGLPVNSIVPEASMYLSVQFNIQGKSFEGRELTTNDDVQSFLLSQAKVAVLPFSWFGAVNCSSWFRISVGTININAVDNILQSIKEAVKRLN